MRLNVKSTVVSILMFGAGLQLVLLVLGTGRLQAQERVYKGDSLPVSLGMRRWFLDTVRQEVYVDTIPYWRKLDVAGVKDIYLMDQYVVLRTDRGAEWWRTPNGPVRIFSIYYENQDGYIGFDELGSELVAGKGYERITYRYPSWTTCEMDLEPHNLRGTMAFCLPYNPTFSGMLCDQWTCWGMLGPGGRWVVQPRYDEPFKFKKGLAKVRSYGRRLVVNENGVEFE